MSNTTPKKKFTVITIEAALHEELRAYCKSNGMKVGFVAEKAVREMLARMNATTQVASSSAITE